MAIKIGDGYGGRKHTYGKHTSYADKIQNILDTGYVVKKNQSGLWLTDIITETVNKTISKTMVDNIWVNIKNRLFKDDHADKNYRT